MKRKHHTRPEFETFDQRVARLSPDEFISECADIVLDGESDQNEMEGHEAYAMLQDLVDVARALRKKEGLS